MKRIIFGITILYTASFGAQAQISSGTTLIGGSLGFGGNNNNINAPINTNTNLNSYNGSYRQFEVAPTAAYFIVNNLAVGLSIGASGYKNVQKELVSQNSNSQYSGYTIQIEQKNRTLFAGPIVRYYTFIGEKFALYGQLSGGYQNNYNAQNTFIRETGVAVYPAASNRETGYYGQLFPGVVFFPTNKFGFEIRFRGLSYNHTSQKLVGHNGKAIRSYFDTGFGLDALQVGASIYLGRSG